MVCSWPYTVHGLSMGCLWAVHRLLLPWDAHGGSSKRLFLGCPWVYRGLSGGCPQAVRGLSVHCPWDSRGLTASCPWVVHGPSVDCPLAVRRLSKDRPISARGLSSDRWWVSVRGLHRNGMRQHSCGSPYVCSHGSAMGEI